MSAFRISGVVISGLVGALVVASAASVAMAADQAALPEQPAPAPNPGMTAQAVMDATSPAMVAAGQPGTTPDQINALRQGDNRLVTNGPVPDTPANRARFGKPMSHAGKKTTPSGN